MDGNTQITVSWLITAALFIFTAYNFFKNFKHEDEQEVENRVKVNIKLDQICNTTSDIKSDIKAVRMEVNDMKEKYIVLEQRIKNLEEKQHEK